MAIQGERKQELADALAGAFDSGELRAVVELVDRALAAHVFWAAAIARVVADVFVAAEAWRGADGIEAVARSARRARRDNPALARAVLACWPYAELAPTVVDELVAALSSDQVALEDIERAAAREGKRMRPLRAERGVEALADLVERLAGLRPAPRSVPLLCRAAAALHSPQRPALSAWLMRLRRADAALPDPVEGPGSNEPAEDRNAGAPHGSNRMLIVLYPEDNDDYSGAIFFSDAAGLPRLVAELDRASLADIPARIDAQLVPGKKLFEAWSASEIEQIEVMLPLGAMLAAVDEWTFEGDMLSIGERHRVVVRSLERNFIQQYPRFVRARQQAKKMWSELRAQRDHCIVHWIEAPQQLARDEMKQALRQFAVHGWLIAAVCTDAPAAARRDALELMIREGVAAAISVRGTVPVTARTLLEPACAQLIELPDAIHKHRAGAARLPVTLLWDDPDFRPEEWR
jgi:effector-associated domain 1 (EAD1)-containing protein